MVLFLCCVGFLARLRFRQGTGACDDSLHVLFSHDRKLQRSDLCFDVMPQVGGDFVGVRARGGGALAVSVEIILQSIAGGTGPCVHV